MVAVEDNKRVKASMTKVASQKARTKANKAVSRKASRRATMVVRNEVMLGRINAGFAMAMDIGVVTGLRGRSK